MLRTTIAVAAAGLGGADTIAALPHTAALGLPDAFARRVARNTQLILLEESNLAKSRRSGRRLRRHRGADRRKLCASRLGAVPGRSKPPAAHGAALEQGMIQRKVAATRANARRPPSLAARTRSPAPATIRNLHEAAGARARRRAAPRPKQAGAKALEPLPSIRLAEPFEALARRVATLSSSKTGARPKVFLANLGKLSDFTARAMFAKNFYEAGGIEAIDE